MVKNVKLQMSSEHKRIALHTNIIRRHGWQTADR